MIVKKTMLLVCIGTLILSSSSATEMKAKSSWKNLKVASAKKKKDCVNCYATPLKKSKPKVKHYGVYEYEEPVSMPVVNKYIAPVISTTNSASGSYAIASKLTVQVGAFRNYAGAKRFKKRYSALSSKYGVSIRRVYYHHKPLYRVQIRGFKNNREANSFIAKYGTSDAFLVRR